MKKCWGALLVSAGLLAAPASANDAAPEGYRETLKSLNRARLQEPFSVSRELQMFRISGNLWAHRSYFDLGGQRLHANGMILIEDRQVTIIDSPWTPSASNDLLRWLDDEHPGKPVRLVITHAHDDRMGGLNPFADRMLPVYSHQDTARLAREQGWTAPNYLFEDNLPLRSGDRAIELFHPGPAHTSDNIVVWFPEEKVLFGGCMVKSEFAESLGYLGEADRQAWPDSLRRAAARYPDAQKVVPGHGLPGDPDLITRTLELLGH